MSTPTLTDAEVAAILHASGYIDVKDYLSPAMAVGCNPTGAKAIRAAFARGVAAVKESNGESFRQGMAVGAASVDFNAVKREAAREALTRCAMEVFRNVGTELVESFRDRTYPAPRPAPPTECRLSDGSVVTRGSDDYWRRNGGQPIVYGLISRHWVEVLRVHDTGADFDALKAFAAAHTEGSTDGR